MQRAFSHTSRERKGKRGASSEPSIPAQRRRSLAPSFHPPSSLVLSVSSDWISFHAPPDRSESLCNHPARRAVLGGVLHLAFHPLPRMPRGRQHCHISPAHTPSPLRHRPLCPSVGSEMRSFTGFEITPATAPSSLLLPCIPPALLLLCLHLIQGTADGAPQPWHWGSGDHLLASTQSVIPPISQPPGSPHRNWCTLCRTFSTSPNIIQVAPYIIMQVHHAALHWRGLFLPGGCYGCSTAAVEASAQVLCVPGVPVVLCSWATCVLCVRVCHVQVGRSIREWWHWHTRLCCSFSRIFQASSLPASRWPCVEKIGRPCFITCDR